MRVLFWAVIALLMMSLSTSPGKAAPKSSDPRPAGIGVRMTHLGPVFVDAQGMTLYTNPGDVKPNRSTCTTQRVINADAEIVGVIPTTLPNGDTRRTCADKNPALLAEAGANPVGKWTLIARDDGGQQWTYGGRPVYRSTRDKLPGDVNESEEISGAPGGHPAFHPLMAPLPGAPAEVATLRTVAGVVLAHGQANRRKPLYTSDRDGDGKSRCDTQCVQTWVPLPAANSAITERGDWSIILRDDGSRQWAYQRKPVYTYAGDLHPPQINGRNVAGWQPIILNPPPAPPAGIKTIYTANEYVMPDGLIYTDSAGKPLYVWHCTEPATDRLACDQPGDSPAYWTAVCGAPAKCAQMWRPVAAPANAQPAGGLWSVTTIDPTNPMRILKNPSEGMRVLTYRGRPVYTHTGDKAAGEANGKAYWLYDIADWYLIPAYGQVFEPTP